MNSFSISKKFIILQLLSCRAGQPWEPHQWDGHRTTINEGNDHIVFGESNIVCQRVYINGLHAIPRLQKLLSVLFNYPLDRPQLMRSKGP